MKFSLFFKKIITFLIAFNLVYAHSMQAAVGITGDINASDRTIDIIHDMISSGSPSDLPVAGVSDFFDREHIHLIDNFDLSNYIGKKLYVGYGVYDTAQDHCKFVEQPGVNELSYKSTFAFTQNFNQHSYGISMNRMNYSQCKALADQYGGKPVVIDSISENMFISSNFNAKKISNTLVEKVWVGAKRANCTETHYTNEIGMEQTFLNWENPFDSLSCDSTKLNVKMLQTGKWDKTNATVPAYCVVEFDSEDALKPLKICAPWWKIVRDYPNQTPGLYNVELLKRINQADIPAELNICTMYSADLQLNTDSSTRIAHCTEYYSATVAPECLSNMNQPQCKVNECAGYIQNACTLKATEKVGKGYVKGEVVKNGILVEVKVKDEVYTNEYECPPSPPSNQYCIEDSTVIIYPKECPNSDCEGLKSCILAVGTGGTEAEFDQCYADYPCIKIYGSRDIPPVIDPVTREVTQLKGKCPDAPVSDGSVLTFDVNLQKKDKKTCLEYEYFTRTENITQNCVLERPYTDYEIDMAITQEDIYENNPNCIRLDTVEEALNLQDIAMTFKLNGYMKHKATKVYLDGNISVEFNGGDDLFSLNVAMPESAGAANSFTIPVESTLQTPSSNTINCSAYDPVVDVNGNVTSDWYLKNYAVFNEGETLIDNNIEMIDYSGTYGEIDLSDTIINTQADCSGYATNHGFASYQNSYTYSKNTVTGTDYCTLKLTKVGADSEMSSIYRVSADSIQYNFKGSMSGKDCMKKAICLDGYYNESDFASLTSVGSCSVVTGEGSPSSYEQTLYDEDTPPANNNAAFNGMTKEQCTPTSTTQNAGSTLDGVENIFIFEDYIRGGFGYYSNFNAWPILSNGVTISSGAFMDKKLPIQEMSRIGDYVQYHGIYTHESHKAKKPDLVLALAGGAIAGAAAYFMAMALLTVGLIFLIVFLVILVFMTKSKNMDRQYTEWHVYKDIPNDLYDLGAPYETRLTGTEAAVAGEKSLHTNPPGFKRMTYFHVTTDTGRLEPGPFKDMLLKQLKVKQGLMVCGGFELSEVNRVTHPDERSINYGYPKCKWYQPWCTKCNCDQRAEIVTNDNASINENVESPDVPVVWASSPINTKKVMKDTGTVYIGATNNLMVLVPYIGDYKLEAYNKYDTLLSTRVIHESSFAGVTDPNELKYAQVNFGLGMNLAPGLVDGGNQNACINDRSVEWGGGVSGVFFESQRTDFSNFCQKSNNGYVADQSMTKIYVQPLNMDRGFMLELEKPMPFPNRVWIATLDNREIRNYRCYDEWPECTDTNFVEVQP